MASNIQYSEKEPLITSYPGNAPLQNVVVHSPPPLAPVPDAFSKAPPSDAAAAVVSDPASLLGEAAVNIRLKLLLAYSFPVTLFWGALLGLTIAGMVLYDPPYAIYPTDLWTYSIFGMIITCIAFFIWLCQIVVDLIAFPTRHRMKMAVSGAHVHHGTILKYEAHDGRFHQFLQEQYGLGGRTPLFPGVVAFLVSTIVWAVIGGLFFGFIILKFVIRAELIPPLAPLAAWCFGGMQVLGLFFLFKSSVANRVHRSFARDHGGFAVMSKDSILFNGEFHFLTPATSCKSVYVPSTNGRVAYFRVNMTRRKYNKTIYIPILDDAQQHAMRSALTHRQRHH